MDKVKGILILAIALLIAILLLRDCSRSGGDATIITTEKHFRDTTYVHDTTYIKGGHTFTDILLHDTIHDTITGLTQYSYPVKDSLIEGTILVKSKLKPNNVSFKYESTIPVYTNTVTIKDSVHTESLVGGLYLVGGTSISPFINQISIGLDYTNRKGWIYGYQYQKNFSYEDAHSVRIGKLISFKKNKKLH